MKTNNHAESLSDMEIELRSGIKLIPTESVKEFIQKLKEVAKDMYVHGLITHGCRDYLEKEIDKLAGEELIK